MVDFSETRIQSYKEAINQVEDDLSKSFKNLHGSMKSLGYELERIYSETQSNISKAESEFTEANSVKDHNESVLCRVQTEKTENESQLSATRASLSNLSYPSRPMDNSPEAKAQYENELDAFRIEKAMLEAEESRLSSQIASLNVKIEKIKNANTQLEKIMKDIRDSIGQLKEYGSMVYNAKESLITHSERLSYRRKMVTNSCLVVKEKISFLFSNFYPTFMYELESAGVRGISGSTNIQLREDGREFLALANSLRNQLIEIEDNCRTLTDSIKKYRGRIDSNTARQAQEECNKMKCNIEEMRSVLNNDSWHIENLYTVIQTRYISNKI